VIISEQSHHGDNISNPSWIKIVEVLEKTLESAGTASLSIVNGPEIGPQILQVSAENGYFILSLGEDDGEDYNVRTASTCFNISKEICILGNSWDSRMVCTNPDFVIGIFKGFFSRGNVSYELLS
jgi:hypothetical protein